MMKCIIISDSHGRSDLVAEVLRRHRDAEVVFFLGDGLSDIAGYVGRDPALMWLYVKGNCDLAATAEKCESITLMGKRIFLTHGDLYGVKYSDEALCAKAEKEKYDIVLFGHTHHRTERFLYPGGTPCRFFNPGSLAEGSYGLLTLTERDVLFSHGTI